MTQARHTVTEPRLTELCRLEDVDDDEPFRAEVGEMTYAVFKVGDEFFVTADQCTHGPGWLSEGWVEDCQIECPFHGGKFDLRSGRPTEPPCEVPVQTWTPEIRDGAVWIVVDRPNPLPPG